MPNFGSPEFIKGFYGVQEPIRWVLKGQMRPLKPIGPAYDVFAGFLIKGFLASLSPAHRLAGLN